ncbi:MAG TPA: type II toxin-antitoxin system VapC family toxin [Thermoleophilia bacterium]|nr:type II toxin-antitoxin system VapC family toxin [Thermoleophilia bacterium]
MFLPDLNVLISAHRADSPMHPRCRDWLLAVYAGDESFGICPPVLIGLVRILTHPRVFRPPDTHDQAFAFVNSLMTHPNALLLNPGRDHLALFEGLCREADAHGDLVTDAYLAALALETGAVLVTADRDFARFPGLRRREP